MFNMRGTEQLSSIGISLAEYLLAILMLTRGDMDKNVKYTQTLHIVMYAHQSVKKDRASTQKNYVAL